MNAPSLARLRFVGLTLFFAVSLAEAQLFTATDLGILDYPIIYGSGATGINNAGTVVGSISPTGNAPFHAFSCSNGVMTDLGTLGGTDSLANGINTAGTVVGQANTADFVFHAFMYSNHVMTDLGTLGGSSSHAYSINDAGTIVGYSAVAGDALFHAFSYHNGVMADLGTLGGSSSVATSINTAGTVVGQSNTAGDPGKTNTAGGYFHAFIYSSGVMTDLGTLGGSESNATGINSTGTVVGYSVMAGETAVHAFRYRNGVMTDLGTLSGTTSIANGINSAGTIVGDSTYTTGNRRHAFYFNGTMMDLNSLVSIEGVTLVDANAINDLGQIAASGSNNHSYLLTPIPEPTPTPTPTPSPSGGSGGGGGGGLDIWFTSAIAVLCLLHRRKDSRAES